MARALRGIALSASPHLISVIPMISSRVFIICVSSMMAFPCHLCISIPECPPARPETRILIVFPFRVVFFGS